MQLIVQQRFGHCLGDVHTTVAAALVTLVTSLVQVPYHLTMPRLRQHMECYGKAESCDVTYHVLEYCLDDNRAGGATCDV